jgi:DNA-binding response OmpR family regulator
VATILILDNNLGFAFWLGQALSTSNCEALPAMNVTEATALIGRFKLEVDLVILNPSVPGAADFTQTLRRQQGHLRVATLDPEAFDEEHWSPSAWPLMSRTQ